eukprot:COSAG01_NODE_66084_length_271_cov_0.744186_1_plen_85_part_10
MWLAMGKPNGGQCGIALHASHPCDYNFRCVMWPQNHGGCHWMQRTHEVSDRVFGNGAQRAVSALAASTKRLDRSGCRGGSHGRRY